MVALYSTLWILAQSATTAEKIPPPTRAAVLMALLGILLLGMLMVVATLLGGHWVRRWGAHRRGPAVPPDLLLKKNPQDAPLSTAPPKLPSGEPDPGDTVTTDDTRV